MEIFVPLTRHSTRTVPGGQVAHVLEGGVTVGSAAEVEARYPPTRRTRRPTRALANIGTVLTLRSTAIGDTAGAARHFHGAPAGRPTLTRDTALYGRPCLSQERECGTQHNANGQDHSGKESSHLVLQFEGACPNVARALDECDWNSRSHIPRVCVPRRSHGWIKQRPILIAPAGVLVLDDRLRRL